MTTVKTPAAISHPRGSLRRHYNQAKNDKIMSSSTKRHYMQSKTDVMMPTTKKPKPSNGEFDCNISRISIFFY